MIETEGAGADALFHRDGQWLVPTALSTGPWRPDGMHGGPGAGLFGLAIEDTLEEGEVPARVTIELEKAIPMSPLRWEATRTRFTRRVARLDIALFTAERQVSSARVLALRGDPLPEPGWVPPEEDFVVPGPETRQVLGRPGDGFDGTQVFHRDGCEHRIVSGGYGKPGPAMAWLRLTAPLVAGEPTSPLASMLAVSDFGSALSSSLPRDSGIGLINIDISAAIVRPPVGEWFRIEAMGLSGDSGVALAMARLADVEGHLGVLHLSQLGLQARR